MFVYIQTLSNKLARIMLERMVSNRAIWIGVTLGLLIALQTCFYAWVGGHQIIPSNWSGVAFAAIYMLLIISWLHACGFRLSGSFDYGLIMWFLYPVLIPYALVKLFGWLSGIGFLFLLIVGFMLPIIAYAVSYDLISG